MGKHVQKHKFRWASKHIIAFRICLKLHILRSALVSQVFWVFDTFCGPMLLVSLFILLWGSMYRKHQKIQCQKYVLVRTRLQPRTSVLTWPYILSGTMAPNGSEFSHRVWIPFFIFYPLVLSLRNFSGSHRIVLMYMYTNLLRNAKSRSNWKTIAGVISQWFWCNYFSHNFILYSEGSEKKDSTPILY